MKKIIPAILLLMLSGCVDNSPEMPRETNIESVEIAGGRIHSPGSEISLFINVQFVPRDNNWDAVWLVDGLEIGRESLRNSAENRAIFTRYKTGPRGQYKFQGCIENGKIRVCKDKTFEIL